MISVVNANLGLIPTYPIAKITREQKRKCCLYDLHKEIVPYGKAWSLQKSIVEEKKALLEQNRDFSDTLMVLQHSPVYTLGTGSSEDFLNFDVKNAPFEIHRVERGGEVTYHGPGQVLNQMYNPYDHVCNRPDTVVFSFGGRVGNVTYRDHGRGLQGLQAGSSFPRGCREPGVQCVGIHGQCKLKQRLSTYGVIAPLVMYPIINLRYYKMDLDWYLRALEEVVIRVLSSTFSIKASRVQGLTGVWVGDKKLAAVGIGGSRWIAYHGLALNVTTDLKPFQRIVPCGIRDRGVGSIKGLLHANLSSDNEGSLQADDSKLMGITCKSLIDEFCEVFQVEVYQQKLKL